MPVTLELKVSVGSVYRNLTLSKKKRGQAIAIRNKMTHFAIHAL